MQEIVSIYKKLGETPLQALNRLRFERLEFANQKMTYLGRLDPMAEGLLLVLVGDMVGKEEYLAMDKVYEFEVLWGFETDTYDLLGLVARMNSKLSPLNPASFGSQSRNLGSDTGENFESILTHVRSLRKQKYPSYSSKYWQKARAGEDFETPEREIMIYSLEHLGDRKISGAELLSDIKTKIAKVRGDFRQEEIVESWSEALTPRINEEFMISKFCAHVSSGTYIRSLAMEMGQALGIGALAYSIKRTKVGNYEV